MLNLDSSNPSPSPAPKGSDADPPRIETLPDHIEGNLTMVTIDLHRLNLTDPDREREKLACDVRRGMRCTSGHDAFSQRKRVERWIDTLFADGVKNLIIRHEKGLRGVTQNDDYFRRGQIEAVKKLLSSCKTWGMHPSHRMLYTLYPIFFEVCSASDDYSQAAICIQSSISCWEKALSLPTSAFDTCESSKLQAANFLNRSAEMSRAWPPLSLLYHALGKAMIQHAEAVETKAGVSTVRKDSTETQKGLPDSSTDAEEGSRQILVDNARHLAQTMRRLGNQATNLAEKNNLVCFGTSQVQGA
mmetsp:Transcript_16711/g.41154  ORF Transcript_16711/g.41154 Transcript_16711/m.41154 type:complete len:302 (-) Transcript_16711:259-1164(-)